MISIESVSNLELEYFDRKRLDPMTAFFGSLSGSTHEVKANHRVTANIATHPPRFESLLRTLESIDGQFDEIRIYLNGYVSVPRELERYSTYIGPDLTDNGKFAWCESPGEYYFTLDDDIIYPSDYVSRTLPLIGGRVVSYHGRRLTGIRKKYYGCHRTFLFYEGFDKEIPLDVAGTGVMAFDTDVFCPTLWRTPHYRMTDLLLSLDAHLNSVPLVMLPRERLWILFEGVDSDGISWQDRMSDTVQSRFADMIQAYKGYVMDEKVLNYRFDDESIGVISKLVGSSKASRLVCLRSGNGHVVESLDGLSCTGYDTDPIRIAECNKASNRTYFYVSDYCEVPYREGDFVFLDDKLLPDVVSNIVYETLPKGVSFLCSSIVDGVFPESRHDFCTIDGEHIPFYLYSRSDA